LFFSGFSRTWAFATCVAVLVAFAGQRVLSRGAGQAAWPSKFWATALVTLFIATFLVAGGRLYFYGGGGSLALVVPPSYPSVQFGSSELIDIAFTFENTGDTPIRFSPGDYDPVIPPRLHVVAPNGSETPGIAPPPPSQPPSGLAPDLFVELGPGESFQSDILLRPLWNGPFFYGAFLEPGNYTLFLTFSEQSIGQSELPCWRGDIRSDNATLVITPGN
jgi:hypothetical protein